MSPPLQGIVAVLGRVLLCTIFFMSAVGNKIPNYRGVLEVMESKGVPAPSLLLPGAIAFLIVGSISVVVGYYARIGAALLLVFLALAAYYFHNFWALPEPKAQEEMIQFMKNLSMMGAMLFIIGNGPGPMSLDNRRPSV